MKKLLLSLVAMIALGAMTFSASAAGEWTKYRIMLDPGHGGTDPGASGPTKPHEAELALACANKLKEFITSNLGGTVKMTRTTDTYVSLSARKSASISYDPYIFCSIHLNAYNGTASGTETWYYHSTGNSKNLANRVQSTLISEMGRNNRGVKQNGWTVITGSPNIPAILTEGLFVDNKTEHNLIKDKSGTGFLNWVRGHLYGFYTHLSAISSTTLTNPRNVAAISGSTPPPATPTLKVSPSTLASDVVYKAGIKDTVTFTVSGSNLTSAVALSSNNANFKLSATSITAANANKGYEVNVIWSPAAIGTEKATVTVKSGTLSKTVTVTGTAEAPPLKLISIWNATEFNGKAARFGWDATKVRNLAYSKGKLYLIYEQKGIKVVNAQTGADLGDLSVKGVEGGAVTLCDVFVFKGKVYASNIGDGAGSGPLKVYCWDTDQSDPKVVLSTNNISTAKRAGDCMTMTGTEADGKVVFANDNGTETNILIYPITNGTFSTTPTVVKATKADGTQLKTGASTRCYMTTDGNFWITGQHAYSTYLDKTGKQQYFINGNETWGNDIARFKYNSDTQNYAIETVYSEINGVNYLKGQFRLLQKGATWPESKVIQTLPTDGMSNNVSNTSCASSVAVSSTTVGGKNVIETWISINGQGVCYYRSRIDANTPDAAPTYDVTPIWPEVKDPVITVSPASLVIPETIVDETATLSVNVTAENLVNDITVTLTDANNVFSVTPATIAKADGKVTKALTVTYKPTAAGSHSATIKVATTKADGTAVAKTVKLSATAVDKPIVIDTDIRLSEVWLYSQNKGNLTDAPWFSNAAPLTRDLAATPEKLYVLTSHAWKTPAITVVNPETGIQSGTVSVDGVAVGENTLAGIEVLDGTLIGSNSARTTDVFKVYKWTADNAAPAVLINDATHGGVRAGDILSVSGNWTNGAIWTTDGSKVLKYVITNNEAAQSPVEIALTKGGAAYSVGAQKATAQVIPNADGTMWVIGKDKHPTLFSASGEYISELNATQVGGSVHGTAGKIFNFGDKTFGAFTTYTQADGQSLSGGALSLVDLTAEPAHVSLQPANGLGTTRNTDFQTAVSHVLSKNNAKLDLYVAVPFQGIAKYSYDATITGVDNIPTDSKPVITLVGGSLAVDGCEAVMTEVYNISGAKVAMTAGNTVDLGHLNPGVYIVRVVLADGTSLTAKVLKN